MLQQTIQRLDDLDLTIGSPLLICNDQHRFIAAEQLGQIGIKNAQILLEPATRNTAPAIALAALQAIKQGTDPVLLIFSADHVINSTRCLSKSLKVAFELAMRGKLITFGVEPTYPETGYGYIEIGDNIGGGFAMNRFVEKPDFPTANAYLACGQYLWNSGIFMFRAQRYLEELELFEPEIFDACRKAFNGATHDMNFKRVEATAFAACPEKSIDYAVMEKTIDAAVVPLGAGWSDVGSWSALWEISPKNAEGNVIKGDVVAFSTQNTYVHASNRLVAALGVENLVIVETKDAVLVAHRDKSQDVKAIVEHLNANSRPEHAYHREVYRPWGMYESIDSGHRYRVKRITVQPGEKLSLQMHHHRAEHWVVVSGTASVTIDGRSYLVTENESTFIPIGHKHSLENPGLIPLEIIEIQSGAYVGEDDIVRFEDKYGRI